ncbi:MAG TPA: hypothetical protein DDX37_10255 [Candidatus Omnitrophica bacterium]|nr:hypothetical protein [Candidatus Omnitrophota bacterium]
MSGFQEHNKDQVEKHCNKKKAEERKLKDHIVEIKAFEGSFNNRIRKFCHPVQGVRNAHYA